MYQIKQVYRSNYAGENVITTLERKNQEWNPTIEYVPNQVTNTYTTSQAVVFGDGNSYDEFPIQFIKNHRGGEFGTNKLQIYGVNNTYEKIEPDFLVVHGDLEIDQIAQTDYPDDHIVYASAEYLLKYPTRFYLIPQNPNLDHNASAAYMAAFDGHRKIFLLGFDEYDSYNQDTHNEFYVNSLSLIMKTYSDTEFVRVMKYGTWSCNDILKRSPNFRQIGFNEFVVEADLG